MYSSSFMCACAALICAFRANLCACMGNQLWEISLVYHRIMVAAYVIFNHLDTNTRFVRISRNRTDFPTVGRVTASIRVIASASLASREPWSAIVLLDLSPSTLDWGSIKFKRLALPKFFPRNSRLIFWWSEISYWRIGTLIEYVVL